MSYDSWKTTTPQDRQHNEDCICEQCHEGHISNGVVHKLAIDPGYECCVIYIEELVHDGKWCDVHNTNAYMNKGRCLECEFIKTRESYVK